MQEQRTQKDRSRTHRDRSHAGFVATGALWCAVTQVMLPGTKKGTVAATTDLLVGDKSH